MPEDIAMDVLSQNSGGATQASGPVAQRLLSAGMNVNALRTNDVLRKEEWQAFDEAVIDIARRRLPVTGELINRGLQFPIQNALGTTELQWEQMGDMEPADISMSGVTEGERDRLTFNLQSMPLPIIHKDFNVNIRALESSRRMGQPLDTAQAQLAGRIVSESVEKMIFQGANMSVLGNSIPGLTTQIDRNTGTLGADWETATAAGTDKVQDVISMIESLNADNMYGPFGLFVTQKAWNYLADDYKAESDKTQEQRIREVPGVDFIMPSKDLPSGSIMLVQLTQDVIDEVVGMQPTTVQWATEGGMTVNFKVMAIMVPRVRSTKSGQSGVAHFTT